MILSRRTLLLSTAAGLVSPWRLVRGLAPADLALFHTNDIHGRVDVEGEDQGLVHLARELRRQRALYPATLTLDAGDIIHGTPMEQRHGPAPVLTAFGALGYDVATAGNHEFDFGPANFQNAVRLANFPFLSANIRTETGKPWGPLRPSIHFDRAGRRVAIFGVTTLETPKIQWPRTIEGIHFTDPFEAARQQVKELRDSADLLICLSHLGYAEDRKLAHEASGIDLIIGGHSHTRLEKAVIERGVPIVQTGAYGKAFGRIEVRFEGKTPNFEYTLFDAPHEIDRAMETAYAPFERALDSELEVVLATLANSMDFSGLNTGRSKEGEFLAQSVRAAHKTDIGLFSSSQISGRLDAGPVKRKDVYRVMAAYTRQHIVRMRMPADLAETQIAKAGPSVQVAGTGTYIAGPAHVMQDLFLGKPGVEIVYDDPLGPTVRDAVMEGFRAGLAASV